MNTWIRALAASALLFSVWTLGCDGASEAPEGSSASGTSIEKPPNVVLVLLDTFRADRVGRVHMGASMTPRLDALAAESVVFDRAYSHAPWTLPSVASLMTSRAPAAHGAGGRLGAFTMLDSSMVTLAETLAAAGHRTHAVTNVIFMGPRFGTMQGFDGLDFMLPRDNQLERIAERTTADALDWVDRHASDSSQAERPFFLLVHYFDAHLTYDPPGGFRRRFAAPEDVVPGSQVFGRVKEMVAFRRGERALDPDTIARLEKLYDGEVAYLDQQLGVLLDGLDARGRLGDSLVVVTADHGEEFSDHGGFEHGHTLYDELLHVPLIVRPPGGASPARRVDRVVGLVDVAPTVVDWVGVAKPPGFEGQSLMPHLKGQPAEDHAVVSTGNMWGVAGRALHAGRYKLIEEPGGDAASLFDLETDVDEQVDLAVRDHARVTVLRARLDALDAAGIDAPTPDLSDEERERLRALGYGQ